MTLRLRGSKTELEEMGEDVSDMATTTSQLQAKLLALTGGQVDIMLDANTFKNSTQILREMAEAWEDMTDIQRASALELMGGKRQANVLSALIQNFDTVEKVIETSANSTGSALKENERYLDSIQGKIDQFNNALQAMWSDTLDSDVVKWFVNLGTELIRIVDTLGLIPSILLSIASFKILQSLFKGADIVGFIKSIGALTMGTKVFEAETRKAAFALMGETVNTKLASSALVEYAIKMGLAKSADVAKMTTTQLLGLSFKALGTAIWSATKAIAAFLFTNPVGWLILAIGLIVGGIAAWNKWGDTTENLQKRLEDLKSEISDMKSELESLNSELETTQDRMEELLSKDSLSFTEEEELKNLQLQNELLEKKIKLQEMLLKNKIKEANRESEELINREWNGTKADKKYAISYYDGGATNGGAGFIKKDDMQSAGVSGQEALKIGIQSYIDRRNHATIEDDLYSEVLKMMDENDGKLSDDLVSRVEGVLGWDQGRFEELYGKVIVDGFYDHDAGAKNVAEHIKSALEGSRRANEEALRKQEVGIEMVMGDLLKQIPEDYEYGTSEIIDQAFDELTAYTLKYENAQGKASKSEIINTIFGTGASEELQSLEKELREIASSEDDVAEKTQKAQDLIQKAYESTNDGYKRLKNSIDIVDISVDELAKSFIATSEAANLGTIGGVLKVFAGGEDVLNNFKNGLKDLQMGIDEAGNAVTWNNLFDGPQGDREAYGLKVSAVLKGADESIREQFTKLIEEVENGKMGVDEALSKWKMAGVDKAVEALNTEFEALNNEMFPDAADEISGLIDTLSELKSAFESVANTMDTFKGAQEEYNNTGRVSIKTALELMSSTDDWDKILNITEDSVQLVKGAEEALMKSQLESIAKQTQTAADLAKIKLDAARNAQSAKEAFDAEANAANNLSVTEQNVNTTQQNANVTTQQRTGAMGDLAAQTYVTAISELDYAANDGTVQTAESVKAKAIGLVSASIVGLDAFIEALLDGPGGKTIREAFGAYQEARNVVVADADSKTTTVSALAEDYKNKQAMAKLAANGDNYGEFSKNWENTDKDGDGVDDDVEDVIQDGWEKLLAKYENKLALITNERDRIQAEIDKAEARGGQASKEMYDDLIRSQLEEKKLLEDKKAALEAYLAEHKDSIDKDTWTEYNNEINETAVAIKECTTNIYEFAQALRDIDMHYFEQATDEISRLAEEIDWVMSLFEDEDMSDEAGNWTEAGITRINLLRDQMTAYAGVARMWGDRLTELKQMQKGTNGLYMFDEQTKKAIADDFKSMFDSNKIDKATYDAYMQQLNDAWRAGGFSEEIYNEWVNEAEDGMRDAISSQKDVRDEMLDMYDAYIDKVEEGIQKEIEAYEDLIDVQKQELDAARELHDFRKSIESDSKDIQELERRIASLSGSTAASDIAERRKLEAQLREKQGELDDRYYEHSNDARADALDSEAEDFAKAKEDYVEGMREAAKDTEQVINKMILNGIFNADVANSFLSRIQETYNAPLSEELTVPWGAAADRAIAFKDRVGIIAGEEIPPYVTMISDDIIKKLGTDDENNPWNQAISMANKYADFLSDNEFSLTNTDMSTFEGQINGIIGKWNEVEQAANDAYAAQSREYNVGGNESVGGYQPVDPPADPLDNNPNDTPQGVVQKTPVTEKPKELTEAQKMVPEITRFGTAWGEGMNAGKRGDNGVVHWNGRDFNVQNSGTTHNIGSNLYKAAVTHLKFGDRQIFGYKGGIYGYLDGVIQKLEGRTLSKKGYNDLVAYARGQYASYAKGTTGTPRDEWAITDEPQFGDELVLVPGKDGNLSFMRKGTGVVPADMTQKLFELAQIPTSDLMSKNLTAIVPNITKNDFKNEFNFESLVHVDTVDSDTLPKLEKMVDKKIDDFSRALNYSLKKFAR